MATLRTGTPAPAPSLVMVAVTRPFLPVIKGAGAVLGPVPVPPERPFALGDDL
jgi:rare lipoprotein A